MASDWASYLRSLKPAVERGALNERQWAEFERLAGASSQANMLARLAAWGKQLTPAQQVAIVVAVARVLEKSDWSPAMADARKELVRALDALLEDLNAKREDSAASALGLSKERTFLAFFATASASSLLLHDPPVDTQQMVVVGTLCNVSLKRCWRMIRHAIADKERQDGAVPAQAMTRLSYRVSQYDAAARAINQTLGKPLFELLGPLYPEED